MRTTKIALCSGLAALAACASEAIDDGDDKADQSAETLCRDPGEFGDPSPAAAGCWSEPFDIDVLGMHAAMLHTGKLLLFAGHGYFSEYRHYVLWDPETATVDKRKFDEDVFCSGHSFLADGRLLVTGGKNSAPVPGFGINAKVSFTFDPATGRFTRTAGEMDVPRWYPSLVTLGDGRVIAAAGENAFSSRALELFDPATGKWSSVAGSSRDLSERYPAVHLLPTGQLYSPRIGWSDGTAAGLLTLDLAAGAAVTGSWQELAQPAVSHEEGSTTFHVDDRVSPARAIMRAYGGGQVEDLGVDPTVGSETSAVEEIDLTDPASAPAWRALSSMQRARTNVSTVMLPDGKVLAIGGKTGPTWTPAVKPVFEAEVYDLADPGAGWKLLPRTALERQYHNTATLLPDGRVFVAGGHDTDKGGIVTGDERDIRSAEIYSPPYMFADRPELGDGTPAEISYATPFVIPTDADIRSVVLISPTAVTHHTDSGRFVDLAISGRDGAGVKAVGPSSPSVAPPGFYLLFAVDGRGIPSRGKFVHLVR